MKKIFCALMLAASLSGCVVAEQPGHRTVVYSERGYPIGHSPYEYRGHERDYDRDHDHDEYHCPPGHWKKGWC